MTLNHFKRSLLAVSISMLLAVSSVSYGQEGMSDGVKEKMVLLGKQVNEAEKKGDYLEAIRLREERLTIEKEVLGENHKSTATSYNNLAYLYYTLGQYDKALPLYQKALAIREKVLGENHSSTATSYNNLASLYDDLGQYDKALPLYQKALSIKQEVLGENHESTATSYNNLASLYYTLGQYDQALPLYQKTVSIREKVLGENHESTTTSYNNLALLYKTLGQYDKALPLYQKALSIKQEVLGENHESTATSYNNLASLYYTLGQYDQALPLYQKTVSIREKVLGENHESTTTSYNNLALLYKTLGQYDKALPLYQKALSIKQEVLGENHESTATSYNNLASLYKTLGQYDKALPLYQKALAIREKVLGENHESTATSYNNLASLYDTLGQYDKALPLYQKALAIYEKVLGENHKSTATSYNNLASLYYTLGQYDKALPLLQKALAIDEKVLGENHESTATSYNNLASLYDTLGQYDKALPLYQKALVINEKVLGENHKNTASSYNNLASLYKTLGQYDKALPLYQKALAIDEKVLGENHESTATSYNNLASLYETLGQYDKALPLLQKALAIDEKVLGENHPETATSYNNLASLYYTLGQYDKALSLHQKALTIREKVLGENHESTATSYNNLASLYEALDQNNQALPLLQKSLAIFEKTLGKNHLNTAQSQKNLSHLYSETSRPLSAYHYAALAHQGYLHNQHQLFLGSDTNTQKSFIDNNQNYTDHLLQTSYTLLSTQSDTLVSPTAEELSYTPTLSTVDNTTLSYDTYGAWLNSKGAEYDNENLLYTLSKNTTDPKVKALVEKIQQTEQALAHLYKQGTNDNEPEKTQNRIKTLESTIQNLQQELAAINSDYRTELGLNNLNTQDLAKSLTDKQLFIDFAYTSEGYYVFGIDHQANVRFYHIDKTKSDKLNDLVAEFQDTILTYQKEEGLKVKNTIHQTQQKLLSDIYAIVNVNKLFDVSQEELIISADGVLRLLPFEALTSDGNTYLIEQKNISYIPSGKEWLRLQRQNKAVTPNTEMTLFYNPDYDATQANTTKSAKTTTDAVLANNVIATRNTHIDINDNDFGEMLFNMSFKALAGTKKEGESIGYLLSQKTLNKSVRRFESEQVNQANLLATKNTNILHIASHGFFLGGNKVSNPMLRSGLALSGAVRGTIEGKVTALDLSGLDLSGTSLVVLSACETGKVDPKDTEMVSGLTKAFMRAGANNVMMSLWIVPDGSTADLMTLFYKNLYQVNTTAQTNVNYGNNPTQAQHSTSKQAHALRQAKLTLINDGARVADWAGFVLSGG